MNNDLILNIVASIVLILGSLAVVFGMIGIVSIAFYFALEHIVDCFWGVRNVCEYFIDKHKREREEKYNKKVK